MKASSASSSACSRGARRQCQPGELAGFEPLAAGEAVERPADVQQDVLHQQQGVVPDQVAQAAVALRRLVVGEVGGEAHHREHRQDRDAFRPHAQQQRVGHHQRQRDHAAGHGADAQRAGDTGQHEVASGLRPGDRRAGQEEEGQQRQPLRQEELALEAPGQVFLLHPREQAGQHHHLRHQQRPGGCLGPGAVLQDRAEGQERREHQQVVHDDQEHDRPVEHGEVDPEQEPRQHDAVLVVERPPFVPVAFADARVELHVARPHVPEGHAGEIAEGADDGQQRRQGRADPPHPEGQGLPKVPGLPPHALRCPSCGRRTAAGGGSPA